jgi:hypothetical protein
MARIFISYRRGDSEGWVARLADDLRKHFPSDEIFLDVASIDPGAEFPVVLDQALAAASAMLVVIGPRWLTATDRQGRRRLEQPGDFVRQEIAESLRRPGVRVFPLLVERAEMPSEEDLPEPLKPLTRRQAFELTSSHWSPDVERLVQSLRRAVQGQAKRIGDEEVARDAEAEARRRTEEEPRPKGAEEQARKRPDEEAARPKEPQSRASDPTLATLRQVLRIGKWRALAVVAAGAGIALAALLATRERSEPPSVLPLPAAPPEARVTPSAAATTIFPGQSFRDCAKCPEMVVIPSGSFTMGSSLYEDGRFPDEGPQHQVRIARALAVGKYEVTFEEWDACVAGRKPNGSMPPAQARPRVIPGATIQALTARTSTAPAASGAATRRPRSGVFLRTSLACTT